MTGIRPELKCLSPKITEIPLPESTCRTSINAALPHAAEVTDDLRWAEICPDAEQANASLSTPTTTGLFILVLMAMVFGAAAITVIHGKKSDHSPQREMFMIMISLIILADISITMA
jgi:membrane protein insertase Oxa1/YidC/SpoIIIJ